MSDNAASWPDIIYIMPKEIDSWAGRRDGMWSVRREDFLPVQIVGTYIPLERLEAMQALLDSYTNGNNVLLPCNEKQAKLMILLGERFLNDEREGHKGTPKPA